MTSVPNHAFERFHFRSDLRWSGVNKKVCCFRKCAVIIRLVCCGHSQEMFQARIFWIGKMVLSMVDDRWSMIDDKQMLHRSFESVSATTMTEWRGGTSNLYEMRSKTHLPFLKLRKVPYLPINRNVCDWDWNNWQKLKGINDDVLSHQEVPQSIDPA